jgi:large subunit ribosomal protein L13
MSIGKTWVPKKGQIQRQWLVVDAKDKTLGRLASRIAIILQGKHKPTYTSFLLSGDYVIVINARYIKVTGNKWSKKTYDKYSGYPSGRKEITLQELFRKNPSKVLYLAIKGMLPKNRLAKRMLNSLKIYPENNYPHQAQNPKKLEL